jgi:TolB-like protein/tetratricopeptide (TPR) repeat protein
VAGSPDLDLLERLQHALADCYQIERELGRGGMATVYLAEDLKHGRRVALKVLRPEIAPALGADRFHREIAIAARLQHPHILGLFDSGVAEGMLWYTMPWVDGESLRARLRREVQLEAATAVRIAGEVADALACAHAAGVIHRDIKPENILLTASRAMVADFGIAHALDVAGGDRLTETGLALGTPQYMSPEQAAGGRSVDLRSDVYALGCVVYEMLAGEPPFNGPTPQAVLARHSLDPVRPLRTVRPTLSPALESAVSRSLAKVPADRYPSALEFKQDLIRSLEAPGAASPRPSRRYRGVTAAVAFVLLAIVATGLGSGLLRGRSGGAPAEARIESLAVAPLSNLTGDSTQVYLAAGITDQLVTTLAQTGSLRVVALKGPQAELSGEMLAEKHRIDALLDGSLQRSGESVRITVRLTATPSGRSIWARSYDGDMRGILGLQDQVARAVAERVQGHTALAPGTPSGRPREVHPSAYEAYVRGMYFLGKVTEADFRKGIGYFTKAIDLEPTYAAAYFGLADCYGELGYYALSAPNDAFPRSRAAALQALELDSTLAEAHGALARVEYLYSWNFEAGDRGYRRAVELRPNSARIRLMYHTYLAAMGRREESIAQARVSLDLDPLSLLTQAAASRPYYNARRYEDALAQARKTLEIDSTFSRALFWAGLSLEQLHRTDEAIRTLQQTIASAGRIPVYLAALGHAYGRAGRRAEALALLEELRGRGRTGYLSPFDLATVYVGLNMPEDAFRALEEAYVGRAYGLVFMAVDPRFDPIRSDPRYRDLIRRVGLPAT